MPGGGHVLLNRQLRAEFLEVLDGIEWDVALLQEVPPTWVGSLGAGIGAESRFAPTARNWMGWLTRPIWSRRPHLVGSWEGGGNLILVRRGRGLEVTAADAGRLTLLPERRVVQHVRLAGGPDVFNIHASTGQPRAADDVIAAADRAEKLSAGRPFILGGDFNCRPDRGRPFPELSRRFGLTFPPAGMSESIDHLLARGLAVLEKPRALEPEVREVVDPATDLRIRLSDHDPVVACFEV